MRFILTACAAALIAVPAAAQYRDAPPPEAVIADRLNDPALQAGIAASMAAMMAAVLDTRVGGFAKFTDRSEDIRPNDTLGDLVARDDPYAQERLYHDTRRSTAMLGAMAGSFASIMPQLRANADRLSDEFDRIDRDYSDDYGDYDDE